MIWVLFAVMLLAAALVVAWPLFKAQRRLTFSIAAALTIVFAVSALVYSGIGTPVPPESQAGPEEMVAALHKRLKAQPDDVEGWRMLGRSYLQLQDPSEAVSAFERAAAIENPPSAGTLADLGEALLIQAGDNRSGRPGEVIEAALALQPGNPKALFYGGIVAIEKGNRALAADRWETLLAQSPPPEVADILRQKTAEWRQEASAVSAKDSASNPVVAVRLSLGQAASEAVSKEATVFIIARDPAQPTPPIAVARRRVSELPTEVRLGDADAMMPGRLLSAFDKLEIVARVSASGEPAAQAGDWYGEKILTRAGQGVVDVTIEQQVE